MPRFLLLFAALTMVVAAACNDDDNDVDNDVTPDNDVEYSVDDQPDNAAASFVSPSDGDTVSSPVAIAMAAEGVEIVPAGPPAVGEGHFHVAVDIGCIDEGELIPGPSEEAEAMGHYHFGDGSTEAELDLEPGDYELCVQLADGIHVAYGDTETINITVE
jgi:hypothetical protein